MKSEWNSNFPAYDILNLISDWLYEKRSQWVLGNTRYMTMIVSGRSKCTNGT